MKKEMKWVSWRRNHVYTITYTCSVLMLPMKLCRMKLFTVRDYFNQDFISFLDYVAPWKHNYEIYSVNVLRVPFFILLPTRILIMLVARLIKGVYVGLASFLSSLY